MNTDAAAGGIGVVIFLALSVIGFVIAVIWVIFPFLILGRVDKLIKAVEKLNEDQTKRHYDAMKATNAVCTNTAIIAAASSPSAKIESSET